MDRPPALAARGVAVRFGRTLALPPTDLEVAAGEHLVIAGPSGAGKSTLLALLAGALRPSAGSVERRGRVARIHQDHRLVPRLSARANVLHGALGRLSFARSLRWPAAERAAAEALLDRVGLAHRKDAAVRTLSGGEAQRVAIARALMQRPDILLADEPVASLDPANAESVMRLLGELRREHGLTLVTVLHDEALAARHGDRRLRLDGVGAAFAGSHAPVPDAAFPDPLAPTLAESATPRALRWRGWAAGAAAAGALALSLPVLRGAELDGAVLETGRFLARLAPSAPELRDIDWPALLASLLATLRMAVVGTIAAVLLALPLGALAARTLMPAWVNAPVRGLLNLWRAVPSIVWALLFVAAVGLGVVAGVIALVAYSLGYLTKFFYEAFEGADGAAPAALKELGASGAQRFAHAVWPLSLPPLAAACLFMLEYNVRAASVLGLVGAGGIGQELKLAVDWSNWHVVGVILLLLAVAVIAVDALSGWLRRLIG